MNELNNLSKFLIEYNDKKKIIFFSENSSNYLHYNKIINYFVNNNKLVFYIYKDPSDPMHLSNNDNIIKLQLTNNIFLRTFFSKIKNSFLIISTPELGKSYLIRNKFNKYIYINHSLISMHSGYKENAFNNFDYIIASTKYHNRELRKIKIKKKLNFKIICGGYPKIENFDENIIADSNKILVAPSWHNEEIIYNQLDKSIISLSSKYKIIIRPHYETIKNAKIIKNLKDKYSNNKNIELSLSNKSSDDLFKSKYLITDWSGVAYEFMLLKNKFILFIKSNPKINNDNYKSTTNIIFEHAYRKNIGYEIDLNLNEINDSFINSFNNKFCKNNKDKLIKTIYNYSKSSEYIAKEIEKIFNA